MVTFPWVVFGRGLAGPGVVAGPGSVMTTVEDLGVEEPRGEARLQKKVLIPYPVPGVLVGNLKEVFRLGQVVESIDGQV